MTQANDGRKRTDFTGLLIVAAVCPLYFLFQHLGKPDTMALVACICVGMHLLAIRVRWDLRRKSWLWATIAFMLAIHLPLILRIPEYHSWIPAISLLPLGLLDFLLVMGAIWLVEKWMCRIIPAGLSPRG